MKKGYRIIFQSYNMDAPEETISTVEIKKGEIKAPTNCFDFSMDYEEQIILLKDTMNILISEKVKRISDVKECPKCAGKLIKKGAKVSIFHDVLTDHEVKMHRIKCNNCKHELPSTVSAVINGTMSARLAKMQAEYGAQHTFREAESIFDDFSTVKRKINNRNRIKDVANSVGETIQKIDVDEELMISSPEAKELILNVDGGHVKTIEDKRSIEALTSIIYRPENLKSNKDGTRNYIEKKSCAASVKDDGQQEIITNTIISALKEGMTQNTVVTALCDGAVNCWNIVESLKPLCKNIICILDWFHIGKKIQNIAIPKDYEAKVEKVKWHLWRGNVQKALDRLLQIINSTKGTSFSRSIKKFMNYIKNNIEKIVNYEQREKDGLVFTSNLAESTVESLINRRCKGHQHMRWSREGLNPILQLRAKLHTDDWSNKWKSVIANSKLRAI